MAGEGGIKDRRQDLSNWVAGWDSTQIGHQLISPMSSQTQACRTQQGSGRAGLRRQTIFPQGRDGSQNSRVSLPGAQRC